MADGKKNIYRKRSPSPNESPTPTHHNMYTSELFNRITTCALALRHVRGFSSEHKELKASYDLVIQSLPPEKKQTKQHGHARNASLTRACMEFLAPIFVGGKNQNPDRKVKIAMYVAISIADRHAEHGLAKQICDRFRNLDDLDSRVMADIFNLCILNDRTLLLLDKAMVLRKSRRSLARDIQHEYRVEFVFVFFEIVLSALRRGLDLGCMGYAASDYPPDTTKARAMLSSRVSSIATTYGSCFKVDALKKPRPRCNLFPARDAHPQAKIGCDPIDCDKATVDTLEASLLDTKEKEQFVCTLFSIVYHSHGWKDLGNEKLSLRKALAQASKRRKLVPATTDSSDRSDRRSEAADLLLAEAKKETERVKTLLDRERKQLGLVNREQQRLLRLCDDQKHQINLIESEMLRASRLQREELADAMAEKERALALYEDQKTKLYTTIREKRRLKDLYDETRVGKK